jgi:hypothetical protein
MPLPTIFQLYRGGDFLMIINIYSTNFIRNIFMGGNSRWGSVYPCWAPEFIPLFISGFCVAQSLVFCVGYCQPSFIIFPLSFCHSSICPSLINASDYPLISLHFFFHHYSVYSFCDSIYKRSVTLYTNEDCRLFWQYRYSPWNIITQLKDIPDEICRVNIYNH